LRVCGRNLALLLFLVAAALLLVSCAGDRKKDDAEPGDGPSFSNLTAADVKDAVPKKEPRAKYGNHSPYEVFGRKYTVMNSSAGYHKKGTASWYGSKFHGRRTSSGELYDMHLATAAHKSLPLPTYAEVTNLDNGRKVIVKINDRGPFKDSRIIDMSYGAALRLGMVATGTARVDVRVIDSGDFRPSTVSNVVPEQSANGTYLQAGAYGQRSNAEELAGRLLQSSLEPVIINETDGLFRVWLGPFLDNAEVEKVISRAIDLGFERPHRVKP
jgi:rare lipoprotein A